jgi:hypothetical protein
MKRREFKIEAINRYFSAAIRNIDQPIVGPWAPSATWDCKARSIPVWRDYMNDKDLLNRLHPQAIITEPNQAESNEAYQSQGIDLGLISDSARPFRIGRWTVIVYWISEKRVRASRKQEH